MSVCVKSACYTAQAQCTLTCKRVMLVLTSWSGVCETQRVMTVLEISGTNTSAVKLFHLYLLRKSIDNLANSVIPILQMSKLRLGHK